MTVYSYRGIVQLLAQNLGAKNTYNTVYAVAICFAESGGDSNATSGAGAQGLWQILPQAHRQDLPIPFINWYDPVVNAREMWRISGGGQNWAAWTSAWADPNNANYSGFLGAPQPGSAAEDRVDQARAAVTQYFLNPPTGPSGPALTPDQQDEKAVNDRINNIRAYFRVEFPKQIAHLIEYQQRAERVP